MQTGSPQDQVTPPPVSALGAAVESLLRGYSWVAPTERGGYRLVRLARRFRAAGARRGLFRTPQGITLELDLDVYPDCSMAYGLYELDTARTIRGLLRPGDHFVDGGANIGYFTLLAARHVGASGRVDAFEPQPETRQRLEANLRRNGLAGRVTVHPQALADRAGVATIHRFAGDQGNHGTASLFAPAGQVASAVEVPIVRMDEALAGTAPTLVKLDLEGAEALALDGMTELLKSPRPPAIIVEHNPTKSLEMGQSATHVVDRVLAVRGDYRVDEIGWRLRRIPNDRKTLAGLGHVNLLFRVGV